MKRDFTINKFHAFEAEDGVNYIHAGQGGSLYCCETPRAKLIGGLESHLRTPLDSMI